MCGCLVPIHLTHIWRQSTLNHRRRHQFFVYLTQQDGAFCVYIFTLKVSSFVVFLLVSILQSINIKLATEKANKLQSAAFFALHKVTQSPCLRVLNNLNLQSRHCASKFWLLFVNTWNSPTPVRRNIWISVIFVLSVTIEDNSKITVLNVNILKAHNSIHAVAVSLVLFNLHKSVIFSRYANCVLHYQICELFTSKRQPSNY